MNRPNEDLFNRITELVSLLSNTDFEATVNSISRQTNTSPEQTREDIRRLNQLGLCVSPQEIVVKFSPYEDRYDDEVLMLVNEIPGLYYSPYLLFLDSAEKDLFFRHGFKDLRIKDIPGTFSGDIQDKTDAVKEALSRNCCIAFHYYSPKHGILKVQTSPHYLYHNMTDDLWYCITVPDGSSLYAYRLDRIRSGIRLLNEKAAVPDEAAKAQLDRLKLIWGASFDLSEEPVHVRIRISPDTPNLLTKIRADIRDRDPDHKSLYPDGPCWIYEDDIIGLSSFCAWLRTYGASVKVLEPASLAEEIRKANAERLKNYIEDSFST